MNVLLQLKSLGRKETTIRPIGRRLRFLAKHIDLDNPEAVNRFIAEQDWSSNYKSNLVYAYEKYVECHNLTWTKPTYQREDRITRVPTEDNVNKIISHSKLKGALAYSILRDVGMRPIEVARLRVKDIESDTGIVHPVTAKGGCGRTLKLRPSTMAMLKRFIKTRGLSLEDMIFASKRYHKPWEIAKLLSDNWVRLKKAVSEKLQQPELALIRLYDLRHRYGSITYHETKDIIYTQRKMGHRRLQSTLRYIHLAQFDSDKFTVKLATTLEEATALLESGFEYVCAWQGKQLYRKRK